MREEPIGKFQLVEAPSVPLAQRERLVELAVRTAAGRVPVFGGIGSDCVTDSIAMARVYLRLGTDAVMSLLPGYHYSVELPLNCGRIFKGKVTH